MPEFKSPLSVNSSGNPEALSHSIYGIEPKIQLHNLDEYRRTEPNQERVSEAVETRTSPMTLLNMAGKAMETQDFPSSRSGDSSEQQSTKKEMIRFLSRIMDRNKPLFVFNTRLNGAEKESGANTPSFSVITLIHEND